MPPNYKRNVITGAVVLSALAILVWMILTFSGRLMGIFKPRGTPVSFISSRGDGLSNGSPVLYQGVQVGKVIDVQRSEDNVHVKIIGEIDNTPPLPHNLTGQIKYQSQLGSASQIELRVNGTPSGTLAANQEIDIQFAGSSMFPPEMTDFVEQMNRQKLVVHVDQAIMTLQTQLEKFGDVMGSVQEVVGDKKFQDDLRATLSNIHNVTDRANKIAQNLDALTISANATLDKANRNLDKITLEMGTDLDRLGLVFKQFNEISEKVNQGKGTAGAFVNDPRLYDEMTATAKELHTVSATLERLVDQWEHEGVALHLGK